MTRWNFFLVSRIWPDALYLAFSWNLGFYELSSKIVVFQEPLFTTYITLSVVAMYLVTVSIFNEVHLRRKKATVSRKVVYLYYPPYKTFLRLVNVWSTYRAMYMYARYFRSRHPTVFQNEKAMGNLVRLIDQDQLHILRKVSVASIQI
ncbi:hypothetical protein K505DRAFT_336591 [Melanomma pulvis-pyrius CBS 109.77]|uniref:Uncharacterized protein n=1 Tax=Melanomma pulvis-pyrius CBS 109.77 TaxID=1314802 RepID=A0A6A6XEB8_9PLEO|nr:hypothetical protein K505DRAFT_336591 [Melanomma pulvis-pyrius CBS 109.77]